MYVADWRDLDDDVVFTWSRASRPESKWDEGRLIIRDTGPRNGDVRLSFEPIEWASYGVLANNDDRLFQRAVTATTADNEAIRPLLTSLPSDRLRVQVQRVLGLVKTKRHFTRYNHEDLIAGAVAWVSEATAPSDPLRQPDTLVDPDYSYIRTWGDKLGYDIDLAEAQTAFDGAFDFEQLRTITPLLEHGIKTLPATRVHDDNDILRP